jgi:2',3'-cyclic-nucleotide 2'-phosphodiesterase/3'-nucleotidase
MSDVYGIYQYDNTLYVIEVTGDILKRALEHDAAYWGQYDPDNPPENIESLLAGDVRDYNWDMYTGIDYKIDISKPVGERVVELMYNGEDVAPDQTFVLAINNYRGGGGGGYDMFNEGEVLWKSMSEIRDYMAEYIASTEILDPAEYYVQNWSLEPASLYEQLGGEPAAPEMMPESGSSATADMAYVLMVTGGSLVVLGAYLLRRRAVRKV